MIRCEMCIILMICVMCKSVLVLFCISHWVFHGFPVNRAINLQWKWLWTMDFKLFYHMCIHLPFVTLSFVTSVFPFLTCHFVYKTRSFIALTFDCIFQLNSKYFYWKYTKTYTDTSTRLKPSCVYLPEFSLVHLQGIIRSSQLTKKVSRTKQENNTNPVASFTH